MRVDEKIEKYLELRRRLLGDGDSPPFVHMVDMIFPKQYFKGSSILSLWKKYVKDPKHKPIDFYIHIPFCYAKCSYCTCPLKKFNKSEVDNYVNCIIEFLISFEEVFKDTVFRNLYVGGGTPSILSDFDFDKLFSYVFSHFKFEKDGGRCCEMNPLSVSESKISILKKHNFNRISIGIQSLDSDVLKLNNRGYQSEEMVENAIQLAKRAGFKYVNVDLILGLYGDRKEKILKSFRKILTLKPYSISIYPLQPTKQYIHRFFHDDVTEFNNFWNQLINDSLRGISKMAKKSGFVVPNLSKSFLNQLLPSCWSYRDVQINELKNNYIAGFEQNVSVFGVGSKADSKIDGVIKYRRNRRFGNINKCSFSGWKRSRRVEMINYLTETLSRENSISLNIFKNQFGSNLKDEFENEIRILSRFGVVSFDSEYLYFNSNDKKDRFLYLSCFFNDEGIRNYFDRISLSIKVRNNINKISDYLKDKNKLTEYSSLLNKIRSLQIGDMIDGVVTELRSGGVKIMNTKDNILDISIPDDCLYTLEYSKDNKPLFEEIISSKDILVKNRRLVIFLKKDDPNTAVFIKYILPLDGK